MNKDLNVKAVVTLDRHHTCHGYQLKFEKKFPNEIQ